MEPPVSLPKEATHRPAAVATPEPLEDEPDQRDLSHGFFGTGRFGLYPPIAPSVRLSFPRSMAPALVNRSTTVESKDGKFSAKTSVPPLFLYH